MSKASALLMHFYAAQCKAHRRKKRNNRNENITAGAFRQQRRTVHSLHHCASATFAQLPDNACKAAGKLSIIFTAREDWIQDYYKMGFDMVTFGMDAGVMVSGFKKLVADNK